MADDVTDDELGARVLAYWNDEQSESMYDKNLLNLEIESIKRRQRCPACLKEFEAEHWSTECKMCGNPATITIAGEELQIAYIEVDE